MTGPVIPSPKPKPPPRPVVAPAPETGNGAWVLHKCLQAAGVDTLFTAGEYAENYEPDPQFPLNVVQLISPSATGHAARGYGQARRKVAMCVVNRDLAAVQMLPAIAAAAAESTPLVVLVINSARHASAVADLDVSAMASPVAKLAFSVRNAPELSACIAEAVHVAASGRHGPVVLDVPHGMWHRDDLPFEWPDEVILPGYRVITTPHGKQIREAAAYLHSAKRPVIVAGGGIACMPEAARALGVLAQAADCPVVTTANAYAVATQVGSYHLGLAGDCGTRTARRALREADVVLALGTRLDERLTGDLAEFGQDATIIHADIDPTEIGRRIPADVPIVGDAGEVVSELVATLSLEKEPADHGPWLDHLDAAKRPRGIAAGWEAAYANIPDDADVVFGWGTELWQAWHYVNSDVGPLGSHWHSVPSLAAVASALPAALGVSLARPEPNVWVTLSAVDLATNIVELHRTRSWDCPITAVVFTDGGEDPALETVARSVSNHVEVCNTPEQVTKTLSQWQNRATEHRIAIVTCFEPVQASAVTGAVESDSTEGESH